ncbi:phosphatase PAP2 family protein [Streptomyces sp. NPDC059740]|uniref:phosphatase PAP2 family protein n=1 Tax=Streptomyces sp. NPDC059740 TaxID=3346926 RepID=UPI003657628B
MSTERRNIAGRYMILWGLVLLGFLVVLGLAAKTAAVTSADVHLNEQLLPLRDGLPTALAKAATTAASSKVGVAAAVLVPVVLWVARRRVDAVRVLFLIGGTLAVAFAAKLLIHEHRPPQRLWLIPPDNAQSFPSGHTAVATALVLTVIFLTRGAWRYLFVVLGAVAVVGVAFARMYLGVHYLPDVMGGFTSGLGSLLLTGGVARLPVVSTRLEALDRARSRGRHAAPSDPGASHQEPALHR